MNESELRSMVREVLHEALGKGGPSTHAGAGSTAVETVQISTDADLANFIQRLVRLVDDPTTGRAVRAGRHRFTLAGAAPSPVAPDQAAVLGGTITEARINRNAKSGVIILAPDAVITPLARDRARALGLKIERKR